MAVEFSPIYPLKCAPSSPSSVSCKEDHGCSDSSNLRAAAVPVISLHTKAFFGREEANNCVRNSVQKQSDVKVGLGLVAAFDADPRHQKRSPRGEGDCGYLLHGTAIRSNALNVSVKKQNLHDQKPSALALPHSEPIPIAGKAPPKTEGRAGEFDPSPVAGAEASSQRELNRREHAGTDPTAEKRVFGLLPSSPAAASPSASSSARRIHFLEACFLCGRRLGLGCDIFMYRGDTAFCSMDCRQQQIVLDERAERRQKCASVALKATNAVPPCQRRHRLTADRAAMA